LHAEVTHATNGLAAVRAAGLAELVWSGEDGPPEAVGVVPLLLDDQPAVALTWAHEAPARAVARAAQVTLVLSDPRLAGAGWEPLALSVRPTLVEDGDGSLFRERLLDQELRKHPPARALADSSLLRRENWWYLPRLLLLLDPVAVRPTAARRSPDDVVLAVGGPAPAVAVVRVQDWSQQPLEVTPRPPDARGPAVLVGQEVSVPDAERWTVHRTTGSYADGRFRADLPLPDRRLEPPPGLLARVRRQRALERACVRALRETGHG
jgi:hypothetical protein